ncbi:MAG: hypothetical protein ACXVMS_08375 [Flavisolibacter sp.]
MDEYLIVPERLSKPEKIIQHTKDFLSGTINYSDLSKLNINKLSIKVSKDTQSRTLRIMDTLIKALIHRGHVLVFRNGESYVKIDGEDIKIYLREKEKKILNEKSQYSFDKYLLQSTGILCLQIGENFKHKEIVEGKEPMEQQLSRIIAALEITAEEEKQARIKRDKWHAEYERERQEKLAAQQQKEIEIADFNLLLNQAERFNKAYQIREYIDVVEKKAIDSQSSSVEMVAWIKWATQKANWLDPTIQEKDDFLDGIIFKGEKIQYIFN